MTRPWYQTTWELRDQRTALEARIAADPQDEVAKAKLEEIVKEQEDRAEYARDQRKRYAGLRRQG